MIKATVLSGHPTNAEAFEKYYYETHIPLVMKAKGVIKSEYTKFLPNTNGHVLLITAWQNFILMMLMKCSKPYLLPKDKQWQPILENFPTVDVSVIFRL